MIDWDDVMRREGSAVWRTAYRILRNEADADECFQETFLAALEVANRQPIRNWPALLQRIATNRAIDRLQKQMRRRRREEVVDVAQAAGPAIDPTQRAEAEELSAALRWALAQLPPRNAAAFCLHELGDWSYQQLAEQLGTSAGAVGVMLHRTRQKLQELMRMEHRLSVALDERRRR
jgi:RNA polymerase sigma-70 factor (ECF subfamily)